jgi:hypothetical protein
MITEWLRLIHQRLRLVSLIREERHEVGGDLLDKVRKDNAKNCSIKKQLQSTRLVVALIADNIALEAEINRMTSWAGVA